MKITFLGLDYPFENELKGHDNVWNEASHIPRIGDEVFITKDLLFGDEIFITKNFLFVKRVVWTSKDTIEVFLSHRQQE